MMTIIEMQQRRNELRLSYPRLAELSGVPLSTVQKVLGGVTPNPRQATLLALQRALCPEQYPDSLSQPSALCESSAYAAAAATEPEAEPPIKYMGEEMGYVINEARQGSYTLEDYYSIPDDIRVELIDGVLYMMSAPTNVHQLIAGKLHAMLLAFIESKGGSCVPFISPADVQIDCDDRSMLQPDVFVVCRHDKIKRRNTQGCPDLVIEVLSPSSRKKDMQIKRNKYESAGVREYWIVDPEKEKVIVFSFGENEDISAYGFEDSIPIHIFPHPCTLDFSKVKSYLDQVFSD